MKHIVQSSRSVLAAAAVLAAGAAGAADLSSRKGPPILPPPPPPFSWQGFYVGGYAGALLGDGTFTFTQQTPLRGAAFVGGGVIGYNWQWSPVIVLGLEADFGYRAQIQAERVNWTYPSPASGGVLGTARARLGYAFTPRWLAYATAGFAFGTDFAPTAFNSFFPSAFGRLDTGTTVRAGWTAGAGVEYAWSDQLSVKAEYLYAWLADSGVSYSTNFGAVDLNVGNAGHIVRGGLNYHFSLGKPAIVAILPAK
ncbi:MAG: porin family protein [Methylocystaceae bacterium]|nr:MAG: porin family protein [Methylocystaceae bacterium]